MIDLLTAEDVRGQDAEAVAAGTSVETLMENAGWAVARAARAMLGGTYGRRILIACGTGNNAGDGLVAGRVLGLQGAHVTAVLTGPADALNELATRNLAAFSGHVAHLDELPRELERADLVIDAIFGVGLNRAPEGYVAEAIRALEGSVRRFKVLAVDIPSGVRADTGAVFDHVVRADATVTFGGYKPGLLFEPGRSKAGAVTVAQIGTSGGRASGQVLTRADLVGLLPVRSAQSHKRSAGTVLVIAGSSAMPGAAALASAAALHGGAGLTTLCAPEDVCRIALAIAPEITTIPVPALSEGAVDLKALDLLGPRLDDFSAIVCGPGLSTHPATVEFIRAVVGASRVPLVLDADGLNAFVGAPELLAARGHPVIMTPHAGELARLLAMSADDVDADRLSAARTAAARFNAIVVLKGPGTVIAAERTVFVNPTGGPALAQGGTGDALAGLIGAFLAQRAEVRSDIVAAAVWIHGRAADRIAARLAPHPANASALIAEIGPTMHDVMHGG